MVKTIPKLIGWYEDSDNSWKKILVKIIVVIIVIEDVPSFLHGMPGTMRKPEDKVFLKIRKKAQFKIKKWTQ